MKENLINQLKNLKWKRFIVLFLVVLAASFFINHWIPNKQTSINDIPRVNITQGNTTTAQIDVQAARNNLEKQIQESINQGNFIDLFWKISYLGYGLDRICFEEPTEVPEGSLAVNYSNTYNLTKKNCFAVSQDENATTFNLIYRSQITLSPRIYSYNLTPNKTIYFCVGNPPCKVVPLVSINESCPGNPSDICHPISLVQKISSFPKVNVYFEANGFHKFIKFLFVFLLTSLLIKELNEVRKFFFKSKQKID